MSAGAPALSTTVINTAVAVPAAATRTAVGVAQGAVNVSGNVAQAVVSPLTNTVEAAVIPEVKVSAVPGTTGIPFLEPIDPLDVPRVGRGFEVALIMVYACRNLTALAVSGYPNDALDGFFESLREDIYNDSRENDVLKRINGYAGSIAIATKEADDEREDSYPYVIPFALRGKMQPWATPKKLAEYLNANKDISTAMSAHARKELGLFDANTVPITEISKGRRQGGGKTFIALNGPVFEDLKTHTFQPCGYREKVTQENGRWMVTCERTTLANSKKCTLYRITEPKVKVSEVECRKGNLTVIKQIGLAQNLVRDSDGNVRTETEITPVIATIPISSDEKVVGTPITFSRANGKPVATRASDLGSAKAQEAEAARRSAGATRRGGARVSLPDSQELHKLGRNDTKITDLDLDLVGLPRNEKGQEMYPEPKEWESLRNQPGGIGDLDSDQFYALEENAAGMARTEGFLFAERHRPVTHLHSASAQSYLNWLIGVVFRMRAFHSQTFAKLYRAPFDTIAVLESYILNGIGNLEAVQKLPKIKELWTPLDATTYAEFMHPILKQYVKRIDTSKWDSVLPMRNTDLPTDPETGEIIDTLNGSEGQAFQALNALVTAMKAWKTNGIKMDAGNPVQFPFRWPVDMDYFQCIAILDDIVVAFLADVQYRVGYAINFWNEALFDLTEILFAPALKRHLSADLIRYIDTFGNPDEEIPLLIRLDEPRAKVISAKLAEKGVQD